MKLRPMKDFAAALLLIGCSAVVHAGYNVEVQKKSSFPEGVGTMAVLPASCPAEVDCVWLNRFIAIQFEGWPANAHS